MNEYILAVDELNDELFEKFGGGYERKFNYCSDGYTETVSYGEIMIFTSEEDVRAWSEETNEFEPLKPFLMRLLWEEIDKLTRVTNGLVANAG